MVSTERFGQEDSEDEKDINVVDILITPHARRQLERLAAETAPVAIIQREQHGLWRGTVSQGGAGWHHMFGLLKEIESRSPITCDKRRFGIVQQGIIMFYAGSLADWLDPGS